MLVLGPVAEGGCGVNHIGGTLPFIDPLIKNLSVLAL